MVRSTKQTGTDEKTLSVLRAPWLLAYYYVGSRIPKFLPYFQGLGLTLQRAGIKIGLHSYLSLMLLLSGCSFLVSFALTSIMSVFVGAPILTSVLYGLGIAVPGVFLLFGVLYLLPVLLASTRRRKLDLELPYLTSRMSVLAASGVPITRMFLLLEDSATTPESASEANEIVRDVEILGDDVITAMEKERQRSPSSRFAEILEGLVATVRSGGNVKNYLLDASNTVMDLKRVGSKQLIDSLAAFAEIYVTLLVVFPLLMMVMFSVMALIGGGLGGYSVTTLMIFVTYLIIPICAAAVMVMLDSMLVED